jgi:hypothetical protein
VLRWQVEENQHSIEKGLGELFNELGPGELCLAMEQRRIIFFYLHRRLLGFVRVIELAGNHWEIGSAIAAPGFRRCYSGFNKLFTASSLLRISTNASGENRPAARVLIITYNEGVARSLSNLRQSSADRFFVLRGQRFDFSRIRELPPEQEGKLIEIYGLEHKLLAGEKFFLFDFSACLRKEIDPSRSL